MTWPQLVILVWLLVGVGYTPFFYVRFYPQFDSVDVTACTLVCWAIYAWYAWVLHAGGFW